MRVLWFVLRPRGRALVEVEVPPTAVTESMIRGGQGRYVEGLHLDFPAPQGDPLLWALFDARDDGGDGRRATLRRGAVQGHRRGARAAMYPRMKPA